MSPIDALVAFAVGAIRAFREPVLRAAGWVLVAKNGSLTRPTLSSWPWIPVALGRWKPPISCKAASQNESRFLKPAEERSLWIHPPRARLRGWGRETDSQTEVAWRDGCLTNRQRQRNRKWRSGLPCHFSIEAHPATRGCSVSWRLSYEVATVL